MNQPIFKQATIGQRPSASEHNKLTGLATTLAKSLHIEGFADSTGFHTRRTPRSSQALLSTLKLFVVQSEATGDGIYNCYEQLLDATDWLDETGNPKVDNLNEDAIEVLNLAEYDPESTYIAQLTVGDLIIAWQKRDDENTLRWIGVPFRQANADRTRIAYCIGNAPAGTTIACRLDDSATGTGITVHCSIMNGSNLNEALPRLEAGKWIMVTKIFDGTNDYWRCLSIFQGSEDCDCFTP